MKRGEIQIPIFNRIVNVIQANSLQDIENYLTLVEGRFPEDVSVGLDAACYTLKDGTIIIALKESTTSSTILHECTHAVFRIQEQLDSHDEEQFCYLLEGLYERVNKSVMNA